MCAQRSLWLDESRNSPGYRREPAPATPFAFGLRYDVVVVGAGLTGLTTALLFARAGLAVAVLEARQMGAVTTGNTTAKVSLLQGTRYTTMLRHRSLSTVRAYAEGNREGMEWLLRYCRDHGVPTQQRDAFTFAATPDGADAVRYEHRAAARAGLDVTLTDAAELPFPTYGAVRLAEQAQVHPLDVLSALAADFHRHGGVIHENSRVMGVRPGEPAIVRTAAGPVFADTVILATGMPVLDRGLFFAKLVPQRSYAQAFQVPGTIPQGMYLSADSPSRSLRTAPIDGQELLLVGGNGHVVGRGGPTTAHVRDLSEWTRSRFPGAELTHSWSAQDYEPITAVPYVGWLPRGRHQIYLASGFDKWGMTNAVAAALTAAADLLGGHIPWAQAMRRRLFSPADAVASLFANLSVGKELVTGYVGAWSRPLPRHLAEGDGAVSHRGIQPVGRCRVDGQDVTVSAVCPHLGGVLAWNDAERSWDCPLHGSRFAATGARLEGPAVHDLEPVD